MHVGVNLNLDFSAQVQLIDAGMGCALLDMWCPDAQTIMAECAQLGQPVEYNVITFMGSQCQGCPKPCTDTTDGTVVAKVRRFTYCV